MNTIEVPTSRAEAKATGSIHYFTGSPCTHGHVAIRWTRNGECMQCAEVRRQDPVVRAEYTKYCRSIYAERRESVLESRRQAKLRDPERFRRNQANYVARNPEKRRQSVNNYYARNRSRYIAHGRNRGVGLKKVTPPWADQAAIEAVYVEAKRLDKETGVKHHVDHQVPLKGVNSKGEHVVCGLHVHFNLVAIPGRENNKKSNKFEAGQV